MTTRVVELPGLELLARAAHCRFQKHRPALRGRDWPIGVAASGLMTSRQREMVVERTGGGGLVVEFGGVCPWEESIEQPDKPQSGGPLARPERPTNNGSLLKNHAGRDGG